ncbi:MAG: DNA polymerase family X protein [Harvfovirus sp.]|uniref:DNA polymerase family X protein n=1 Tax=Harvfovirus sp. TaxID=2487768 RepID=A0A3G5A207_9VIRU|nr:MAG: DNA polymerase family X protein [Harvfovirus sp.]
MDKANIGNINNQYIIDEFEKLRKQIRYEMDHSTDKKKRFGDSFRLQAIDKVLAILKSFREEITAADQLKGVKGVGKGTLERLDEIIKKGKLSEIKKIDENYLKYVEELEEIYGLGKRKAFELVTKYGIKSVDDLRKLWKRGGHCVAGCGSEGVEVSRYCER